MCERNLLIGSLLAFVSLSSFVFVLRQGSHWRQKAGISDSLRRALLSGLGFAIFFTSGVIALDYIGTPNVEKHWDVLTVGSLMCLASPMIMLTTVGAFVWYLRRDATQHFLSERLNRIIQRRKR